MDPLAQEIADFILSDVITDKPMEAEERYNRLACALFERQYERVLPYRRLCDSLQAVPETISRWEDIPAVPAEAFKAFNLSAVSLEQAAAEFHSSGTTGKLSSRHYLDKDALTLYDVSLRRGFSEAIPDRPGCIWALMPSPADAPHSSLSHMLGALGAERFFWDDDAALCAALERRVSPITLFGTAFAFVHLFDGADACWRLPDGSVVIETGGFKGRSREVPREELYRMIQSCFGVPEDRCWSEYGMSEMASQFYGRGLDPLKRGPHWVRTRCIDPVSGSDAAPGSAGLLRHYDLANFNSVLALQTQDLGSLFSEGFALHGRAPDAELRGCSLTVEEMWSLK